MARKEVKQVLEAIQIAFQNGEIARENMQSCAEDYLGNLVIDCNGGTIADWREACAAIRPMLASI